MATIDGRADSDEIIIVSDVEGEGGWRWLKNKMPTISDPGESFRQPISAESEADEIGVPDILKSERVGRIPTDNKLVGAAQFKDCKLDRPLIWPDPDNG